MTKLELYGIGLLVVVLAFFGAYHLGKHDQAIADKAALEAESAAHKAELDAQRTQLEADARRDNAALLARLDPLTAALKGLRDPKGKPVVAQVFDPNCKPAPAAVIEAANSAR